MTMMTVDLRSDIVTLPTEEMRRAIYDAELGDDVSGEDPTVNRLEEMAAERMGKAAAVLVASGTQGNLLAILAHCRSGDEIIAGANSHIFWNESAGAAALGGIQTHLVPNETQGALSADLVEAAIRPGGDNHYPPTTLICLENTQNQCNGGVVTTEETEAVCRVARDYGIPVHVDGARIFNAAVQSGNAGARAGPRGGRRNLLPLQGFERPHRLRAVRLPGVHCGSAPLAQNGRRRHAAGGNNRRRRNRVPGKHG